MASWHLTGQGLVVLGLNLDGNLPLTSMSPLFSGNGRCFRCQNQESGEGHASAHIVLKGWLRGHGSQVAYLNSGAHPPASAEKGC